MSAFVFSLGVISISAALKIWLIFALRAEDRRNAKARANRAKPAKSNPSKDA
jgi:hypothetical protein